MTILLKGGNYFYELFASFSDAAMPLSRFQTTAALQPEANSPTALSNTEAKTKEEWGPGRSTIRIRIRRSEIVGDESYYRTAAYSGSMSVERTLLD
jgi:hypothetical protein